MEQLVLELAPPPEPTLDNFHLGSNTVVLNALRAALAGGERILYLWGPAGCGKSHLLRAMVSAAQSQGKRAAYFVCAPNIDLPRDAQFLALDEVQRLDAAGQIAVFDAYNRLRATESVLLAAGKLPAADLPLREDLRSRVASGVVMQLRALTEDEKRAVLGAHARNRGLELAPGILDYLLARFPRDLGSLVAAVDALDHYSLRTRRAITLPLLRETIKLQASKP
ncbi:MAG: DnaA regulatory inactivator Hda [Betaproteobacteria bacterium RIFCSPLOWO2_02_FULL_62_17]|nr:MAG: DnaA regulatory inactivator Hda [Betaproteobacteria bacterium RIFCSPLOWO2_02_FULL_62_17]